MKRNYLEQHIGKRVVIKFFDGDIKSGILIHGNGFFVRDNLKYKDYYLQGSHLSFKLSHVISVNEIIMKVKIDLIQELQVRFNFNKKQDGLHTVFERDGVIITMSGDILGDVPLVLIDDLITNNILEGLGNIIK